MDFFELINVYKLAGSHHILNRVHPAVLLDLPGAAGEKSAGVTLIFDADLATEIYIRDVKASAGNNADTTSTDQPKVDPAINPQ